MHLRAIKYVFIVALTALSAMACNSSHTELLEQSWKMRNGDVYYQFNADSSFTAKERQNSYKGKWTIAGDNRTLKMIADNGVVKVVTIKALNRDSMVLVDSYEDIVFKPVK
jgi:hypothetical protein